MVLDRLKANLVSLSLPVHADLPSWATYDPVRVSAGRCSGEFPLLSSPRSVQTVSILVLSFSDQVLRYRPSCYVLSSYPICTSVNSVRGVASRLNSPHVDPPAVVVAMSGISRSVGVPDTVVGSVVKRRQEAHSDWRTGNVKMVSCGT